MSGFLEWMRVLSPGSALLRLLLAAVLGGLIGTERGHRGRAAGMRTHILVAIGASLTALVGLYEVGILGFAADPLRVGAQVISGIGFLGAGTILIKDRFQVTGLTTAAGLWATAAGLWATAAIGLAIGIGFYEAAFVAALLILAANTFLTRMERDVKKSNTSPHVYIELTAPDHVNCFFEMARREYQAENLQVIPAKSAVGGHVGIEIELFGQQDRDIAEICRTLSALDYVAFAVSVM